jgi:ComEC/Rec2-related protein
MVRLSLPAASRFRSGRLFLLCLVLTAATVLIVNHPVITVVALMLAAGAAGGAIVRVFILHKMDQMFWAGCGLALGLFLGGAQTLLLSAERERDFLSLPEGTAAWARIVLDEDSVLTAGGIRLYSGRLVSVRDRRGDVTASARGRVVVFVSGGERLFWGQIIETEGRVRRTAAAAETTFTMNARSGRVITAGFSSPLLEARSRAVGAVLGGMARLGRPAATLLEALLLGVKDELDFELKDAFARTGSLHLLALSGLHVGVIGALILVLLTPLTSKKLKVTVTAVAVGLYFLLAGPSPSLARAVLMLSLAGLGYLCHRETDPLQLLLASAVIILALDPVSVRTLSFQLSYTALAGILTLGRRLDNGLIPWVPRFLRTLCAATLSAQVFTAPIVLAVFGVVYPAGLVISPLLIPLTTVFVWTGIACLLVAWAPVAFITEAARFVMDLQYRIIFLVTSTGSSVPGLTLEWRDWFWLPAVAVLACLALGIRIQRQHAPRFSG